MANWRFDGFKNFISRLGFKGDKSQGNALNLSGVRIISDEELASVWISDGIAKKIVSIRAEDALSQGMEFPNDKDGAFQKELQRLKVFPLLKNALQWADLFGGCVILPMVEDGTMDMALPRADRKNAPVTQLRVYDRSRILSISTAWVSDPNSPYFEDVEVFQLRKLNGDTFPVHASRLLVLKGESVPQNQYLNNIDFRWWGQSFLQPIFQDLAAYGISFQALTHLMQEASVGKFKFPEITALLAQGSAGETKIINRMEMMNMGKSVTRSIFLGEGEEFIRENLAMGDLAMGLAPFKEHVCAVTGFPATRVWGTSPGGLNATGESDTNSHYDRIREYQTHTVKPIAEPLFKMIARGAGMSENVAEFEFKALGAPSQEKLVTMRSTQATTDKTYIDAGVLDADEVRENRFFKRASLETTVNTAAAPEVEEPLDEGEEPAGPGKGTKPMPGKGKKA